MIERNLILANAPLNYGEQVHVNHVGCSSGEDKKRRLYLKRVERGVLAYCHHCNEHGFVSDKETRLRTWINKDSYKSAKPLTTATLLAPVSMEGKIWLSKYHVDSSDKCFSGIKDKKTAVALELHNQQHQPIGWQIRNLTKGAEPKYITQYSSSTHSAEASWFYKDSETLVITEDYLSAYRINKDVGLSTVALLRTSITDTTLIQIEALEFKDIYIWLDPDAAGIVGAHKIHQQLTHYLQTTTHISILFRDKEPKECTKGELLGLLSSSSMC